MQQKKNETFLVESVRFGFLCGCESCIHFDAPRDACSFFWPNGEHRQEALKGRAGTSVTFCKDFELF